MEACSGAHYIGRQLEALGHDVRLIPAQYVKPFLKGHKNDYRDAEAIAEAVQRPTMRFVRIKTPEQMDQLALHRVRARLVGQRTAATNQIRGFLTERGNHGPPGADTLAQGVTGGSELGLWRVLPSDGSHPDLLGRGLGSVGLVYIEGHSAPGV